MSQPSIITLTTDFGSSDAYVGIMKGVMLGISRNSALVDISHAVKPQNIAEGAYLLRSAYAYFPVGTVHLAVVDPGVGTSRRPIAVSTDVGIFVGPDNGLLVPALAQAGSADAETGRLVNGTAVALTEDRFWRQPVSLTFHGRDIFAPVAAHLASGADISAFGPGVDTICPLSGTSPTSDGRVIRGRIIHIDHFGNAVSDLRESDLPPSPVLSIAGRRLRGLARSYQDAPVAILIGSTGLVEVAVRNGNAARQLGISLGDEVVVEPGT